MRVQSRSNATRIAAKGIFPNAEVVRGRDWLWGDQDGKLHGYGRHDHLFHEFRTEH